MATKFYVCELPSPPARTTLKKLSANNFGLPELNSRYHRHFGVVDIDRFKEYLFHQNFSVTKISAFVDEFYDTDDYSLVLKNFSLKQRDFQKWTLKICTKAPPYGELPVVYEEINDECQIIENLKVILKSDKNDITQLCPKQYASIPTIRYLFGCSDQSLVVYLDCAMLSKGQYYTIGTLSTTSDSQIHLNYLEDIVVPMRSKIMAYLGENIKELYKKLENKGYIAANNIFQVAEQIAKHNKALLYRFDKDEKLDEIHKMAQLLKIPLEAAYGALQLAENNYEKECNKL